MPFRVALPSGLPAAFSVQNALGRGASRDHVRNPALARPFTGVRAREHPTDTAARCRAFATVMGDGCSFSHHTAAELWGAPLPARHDFELVHVVTQSPARASKARGTIGHRSSISDEDLTDLDDLRVTTPARTWCDLAAHLSVPDLVAVGDYFACWTNPLVTVDELADAARRHPSRRGKPTLREALQLVSPFSQSRPESILRVELVWSLMPDPVPNYSIRLRSGRIVRFDLAFVDFKLAIEYQGDHHRTDRAQWRSDLSRHNDVTAAGWTTIYFSADDLANLGKALARIQRALVSAGWRPAPAASVGPAASAVR